MSSNFKIFYHFNSDNLHLKLAGDFDGSSALELVNALKENQSKFEKIVINTCELASIHPFGLSVFRNNFSVDKVSCPLTFTGKFGNRIAIEERNLH